MNTDDNLQPGWRMDIPPFDAATKVQLILVRHGQTTWNARDLIQGQANSPLSDLGHEQATKTANYLHEKFEVPHLVLTSDLDRCVHTAEPYEALSGTTAEATELLREIDNGQWCGRRVQDVVEEDATQLSTIRLDDDHPRGNTGESAKQLRGRARRVLNQVVEAAEADEKLSDQPYRVIAFTHAGMIRALVTEALGLSGGLKHMASLGNSSVSVLNLWGKGGALQSAALRKFNTDDHLTS